MKIVDFKDNVLQNKTLVIRLESRGFLRSKFPMKIEKSSYTDPNEVEHFIDSEGNVLIKGEDTETMSSVYFVIE